MNVLLINLLSYYMYCNSIFCAIRPYSDSGNEANCNFFVCDTDDAVMTSNQKLIVDVYSGFSVTMFVIAVLWGIMYKVYLAVQQFYYGKTTVENLVVGVVYMKIGCSWNLNESGEQLCVVECTKCIVEITCIAELSVPHALICGL